MRDRLCDHCLGRPCVYPNPPAPSEAADETRTSGLPRLVQGHPIARRSMRRYYGYYPALEACHGRDLGIAPPLTTSLAREEAKAQGLNAIRATPVHTAIVANDLFTAEVVVFAPRLAQRHNERRERNKLMPMARASPRPKPSKTEYKPANGWNP
jgi:hypothetical protein